MELTLPVGLRTNVNYSYFKTNVLLLIRKNYYYYFQLIYILLLCILLFYIFFSHNRELSLTLFLCINKHSIQFNSYNNTTRTQTRIRRGEDDVHGHLFGQG